MRRLVSNLEVVDRAADVTTVSSNFALYEYRYALTVWAGQYVHKIRTRPDGGYELAAKTVHLVNAGGPIPTMAFLI
jgi:3-phenylpropionate/cinnamic acid dioxygenase small subunit